MNRVILIGRLTKDPEVRYTQSGVAVANFTLAVDRRFAKEGQQQADFIPCIAFKKTAEIIGNNLVKGRQIGLEGRIQVRSYEKDGQKRYMTEVIVDAFDFCGRKSDAPSGGEKPQGDSFSIPNVASEIPDEEIPF